jgi:uncharacterized membrane protein
MNILPSFKKKSHKFFFPEEQKAIVDAIRDAEKQTSGEIRIYVESKNPLVSPLDRAGEIFFKLQMEKTEERNAVLLYFAMKHHEMAVFADEGIYSRLGRTFWDNMMQEMVSNFTRNQVCDGIVTCIRHIGEQLCREFPYHAATDKNELPDEIVFGH